MDVQQFGPVGRRLTPGRQLVNYTIVVGPRFGIRGSGSGVRDSGSSEPVEGEGQSKKEGKN